MKNNFAEGTLVESFAEVSEFGVVIWDGINKFIAKDGLDGDCSVVCIFTSLCVQVHLYRGQKFHWEWQDMIRDQLG